VSAARDEQTWVAPRPDFYIQSGCALDNPFGIHPDEVMKMISNEQPEVVAQTVFGLYVPSSGLVFTSKLILNLFRNQELVRGTTYLDQQTRNAYLASIAHYGRSQQRFKGGVDLARKKDKTCIYVLDTLPLKNGGKAQVVYYRQITRVPWEVIYSEVGYAGWLFGAELKIDSTGAGDVVLSELQNRRYCAVHHVTNLGTSRCRDENDEPLFGCDPSDYYKIDCSGFEFSTRSKVQLLTHLAQSLGHGYDEDQPEKPFGQLACPQIPSLRVQLAGYTWDDKKLETDDVMALALAAWLGVRGAPGEAYVGPVLSRGG
jgi:hypothetical protein